ncbi:non-ribosomal peptide synthetase [Streptomyces sp. NPDC093589]|uniref:non-ribosomal peptide synthetase n=1 Tax=Streptomyces sp. NPDC093589 TaxID=3366043 RepID=UPI00381A10FF
MGMYPHASAQRAGGRGVHDLVAERVREYPDTCALREPGGTDLTYRQLWHRAGRLAATLAELGIQAGEPVAVDLPRGAGLIVALLGVARAGAAYLSLDAQAPTERVTAILAHAEVRAVVVDGNNTARADRTAGIGGLWRLPVPEGEDAVEPGTGPAGATRAERTVTDDSPLYVGYTSGSTGVPKGVVIPHRAVRRLVTDATFCTIAPGDRVGQAANPAFDATTFEVWGALTAGATLVILPTVVELALDRWAALLRDEDITTLFLTTSLFHTVARSSPGALASLRNLIVGGEQLESAAVRAVLAAGAPGRLVNGYGPTETTVFATSFDCTEASLAGRDRIPIGRAIQQTRLAVLDERLRPVGPGQPGELCIGGPGVAIGYLGLPERTAQSFVPDPDTDGLMYRTGDLVRQLADGELELLGRVDRQVKLRGFRIELEEIERAAVATGRAAAAFVVKVGEGPTARLAGAFLPSGPATEADEEAAALTADLAASLPAYMLPSSWQLLESLPLNSTGKADRQNIEALITAGTQAGTTEPVSAGESAGGTGPADVLRGIWTELLGTRTVGPFDDFLSLGGNSLLATQAAARIRELLAVDVEPYDVLLASGIEELTTRIADLGPRQP